MPKKKVLVVDDTAAHLQHLADIVSTAGYQVITATSGREAIVKVNSKHYDIIFLDVMMEGVDGYKVCRAIKASKKAYIVMLTSKKSPFDKVRGTMSGCDAYVTKPPSDESLVKEVKKCIQNRDRKQALGLTQ